MKLYYSAGSPFARKVRAVLLEKGLAFESDLANRLRLPGQTPGPTMAVPVLEDGEVVLWESDLIVDYLLRTYPTAPSGDPPMAPWLARPERHWQDMAVLAALATYGSTVVNITLLGRDDVTPETSDYMGRQHMRVAQCLDWLETQATAEGFAPGWFSVMDIAFIANAAFAETRPKLEWRGRKRLEALYDRFAGRASMVATEPGPPPVVSRPYRLVRTPVG
jgi:glutathione S-transferase